MRKGICMSKKKEREPQWYMSEVGVPVYNYHVYHMKNIMAQLSRQKFDVFIMN